MSDSHDPAFYSLMIGEAVHCCRRQNTRPTLITAPASKRSFLDKRPHALHSAIAIQQKYCLVPHVGIQLLQFHAELPYLGV